jgi:hypothetical protein
MAVRREFKESPLSQGPDERVAYDLNTLPWGGTPTSPTVVIKQNGRDRSADLLTGAAAINGDVITTPLVIDLTRGKKYRLEVKWINSGNTLEAWGDIECDSEDQD